MASKRSIFALTLAAGSAFYAVPSLAEEGGLPQFDTSLFPEQLFWLAVCFAALYALMAFVALPSVRKTQDKRLATIASELTAATAANEQAKAMIAQADKALADARAKAQATVNEIKTQAAKESAERTATQHKELSGRLHVAEANIIAARDGAIRDAQKNVSDLSQAIVEKKFLA